MNSININGYFPNDGESNKLSIKLFFCVIVISIEAHNINLSYNGVNINHQAIP